MKSEGGFRKSEFTQTAIGNPKPVISIITVVFNNVEFVEKTLLSVLNQTYKDKEYILIDGGSSDGTMDIIRKYNHKIDYWVSEPDMGIYDAMNKGLLLAKGTYVLFLNSGDLLENDQVLEKVFNASDPAADIIFGETNLMDAKGTILGTRTDLTTRKLPEKLTWKDMKKGMVVSHQSIIVRKSIAPLYELKYKCSADIEWVIESLKRSKVIVNSKRVISNYLVGGYSIKYQKRAWKERFEIYIKYYGWGHTIFTHLEIIIRNIGYKLSGKKNF